MRATKCFADDVPTCPAVRRQTAAKLQMARGAVGQCVQKVAEAEVLAWGGISDILVSNQIVGAPKLARLCALASITKAAVCVDDALQVDWIERAAADSGRRMTVLVEIDVGASRCGVPAGPAAVDLAKKIAASKHLIFGGLQAYQGSAQHKRTVAERQRPRCRTAAPRGASTARAPRPRTWPPSRPTRTGTGSARPARTSRAACPRAARASRAGTPGTPRPCR